MPGSDLASGRALRRRAARRGPSGKDRHSRTENGPGRQRRERDTCSDRADSGAGAGRGCCRGRCPGGRGPRTRSGARQRPATRMSVRHEEVSLASKKREETIDITPRVKAAVARAKIGDGIVTISVAHTTAAVFVNENADPDVQKDVLVALERAVPRDAKYSYAEGNGPEHVIVNIVGNLVAIVLHYVVCSLCDW